MSRSGIVVLLITAFVLGSPAWSQEGCQYAHVVDPCNKRVVILPVGDSSEAAYQVLLNEGPAAAYEPGGVALATAPYMEEFTAFVIQGPYLHVVDYGISEKDGTIASIRTIDLLVDLALPPMELTGVATADPIELDGETVYPLYLVGTLYGSPDWALYTVLDQEKLLSVTPSDAFVHFEPICMEEGRAIDIAAGASLYGGTEQHAFASVLVEAAGETVQRFYEITWVQGTNFSVSLDAWNDEGVPFTGSEPDSIGLDYDSLGLEAHGVYQTSSVVSDLHTGESTCDLMYDPTDIAIWGPDSWGGYVHFTTASNQISEGMLLGYADGVCPLGGEGALAMAVTQRPLSLAISSDTSEAPWVYTAHGSGSVGAFQLSIVEDETGATITIVDQFPVVTEGCPSAVVIRDPVYEECVHGKYGDPRPTPEEPNCPTTKYCRLNPTDPQCLTTLCAKGPAV